MINENLIPLSKAVINCKYKIVDNPNQKYFELGLYNGSEINVFKTNDRNLVIAVGASRYILPQKVAKDIMVMKVE
ncbi:MAG: FeoA domain-containing protein [Candidatus Cloacimonetes bacterium]|nr:FeoA domain-containing protein [Candidatus Cloacimonadota bacterium]